MKKKSYVVGFIVCLETNEVLLIEKKKPLWQEGFLNGIGGKVEQEDKKNRADMISHYAMKREAEEETGLIIPASDWKLFAIMEGDRWLVDCFIAVIPLDQFKTAKTMEEEKIVVYNLTNLTYNATKLLGNIAWLVHMGLDFHFNEYAFKPAEIYYNAFSFPHSMSKEEKEIRLEAEHQVEKKLL